MNPNEQRPLFPVYAHADTQRVQPVVDALRNAGIEVWVATERLHPGSNWQNQIVEAIDGAAAALVFISPALAASSHALSELIALEENTKPIIPIVIEQVTVLPPAMELILAPLYQIDLTGSRSGFLSEAVERIRDFVEHVPHERSPKGDEAAEDVREVAAALANAVRKDPPARRETASAPRSVFVVHGHDDELLREVEGHLTTLGVESVVLRRIGGPSQSLFQKFMLWGTDTQFALVLLSADDLGVSRSQYESEGVGVHALQFRARQNVILELGFFYGHLGWEHVFVLYKEPNKVFPNFERPSDLGGVVFDTVEESGEWKGYLEQKLKEAGFEIE